MKTTTLAAMLVLAAACNLLAGAEAYVPLAKHSLISPFDKFKENSGQRDLSHWQYGGSVIAKQNFLRLTPDRQSKRGWLFNTEAIGEKNFAIQMRFRISGSGRHLYGDGLALWITQKGKRPSFQEGMLLGHTDTFTGLGIMFDTFRNVEHGHVHKDISLLVSSGNEPAALDKDRPGCEAHYRYYEGADSFDVDKYSAVRIWVENGEISLEVDKYGTGDFKECFSSKVSDQLPKDWQNNLHFGISASTGALADNHDILEFKVAEPRKFAHMIEADEEDKDAPLVQIEVHDDLE
ncbi:Vesicular integral-membrane protein VIP36 [Hondaea fermentalgiana]|uniref:Vesicular integral-membrane protein VIP36 n=1 Tax=Hondaea fermentalgiana TaxID=2315210 RepID=A0A2R5GPU2_9STRA|nr:Vesicular integral-membrane protein VIP36 [Hondaea fermentalgiana]|eukprot:GBG29904.1 Vesicular integral-membrane protein VIP36 [Hondaea fermentalgiana]